MLWQGTHCGFFDTTECEWQRKVKDKNIKFVKIISNTIKQDIITYKAFVLKTGTTYY